MPIAAAITLKNFSDFGFEQDVINRLPGWKHTNVFNDQQKLVLAWAEAVTYSKDNLESTKAKLIDQFTEREIVELTASITLMNTLNKLRITLAEED
ncbi:hypothetical protein [uncultured Chryseobacterium sp.]|uniref:carboxymuconolactone decarboxylase family protein n=1 Tax=uncultured Chryseobacterium sp. TaxID=259322 RepID=UPI00258F752F|nr:hypothetical protein [uncultured Chryseobacterium sp.]